jgi:hypothetical protein
MTTPVVGLPADRLYDWNPGLDSVGGVPDRTTVFTTVSPGGDIQAAIDACPPGEVVQLAAGTFTVNDFLLIDKGITLRGAVDPVTNAPLTFLQKTNGATAGSYTAPDYQPIIVVGPNRYAAAQIGTSTNLTSDAVAGTYSITLASTAGLSPGQFVLLDENDYTSASFIPLPNRNGSPTSAKILASDRVVFMDHNPPDPGDDPFPDSLTWFSRMGRPLNELKEIASISGNTVTFTSPMTITYTASKNAQLTSYVDPFVKYAGIENLSLKGGSDSNVRFEGAAYSWMKNCEDTGWLGDGVVMDGSFRIEVRDSYIHDGAWSEPGGGGYAISVANGSAEALIENNIILHANKMMVGQSAGAGTVVAYNYADDGFILTDPSWQEVGINGSHMVGSHSWLFEGNESFNYDSDNTHGNAIYMTVFRNDLTGDRTDFPNPEGNARAVGLMFGSWWQSIIGNVLGTPGQTAGWAYQSPGLGNEWSNDTIWEIGYDPQHWEQDADPKTVSTLIRGGNYDYVTNSVHWENIASQTLPNSLYLSGKPAFFGSDTWPWVDPTGSTKLYILPAKARYDADTPFLLPVTGPPPPVTNPPPPAGTTALMIMSNPSTGAYQIYNVGGNAILAAYELGHVGAPWTFGALGTFQAGDSSDMLLRNTSTGAFEAYYISGNNIVGSTNVGAVGLEWNFAGTGNFDGASSLSELLLRNVNSGSFELYHVAGGGVLSGQPVAPIGNNVQVKGFGDFSGVPTTQMMMQDTTGTLWLYTYNPSIGFFSGQNVGAVGSNLDFIGCADLRGNGATQIVMQQNNGTFWIYTYTPSINTLSGIQAGAVGSDWHVVGLGPLGTAGQDEMLMQDAAGRFEVYQYNASLNAFVGNSMGAVGAPWIVDAIAGDPPNGAGTSTGQLVQAMAGFGGGSAGDTLSTAPLGADTSQQTFLTTPQHA